VSVTPGSASSGPSAAGGERIGVVAWEMEGRRSGVGRYLEGLLRGLRVAGRPDREWVLFFKGEPFAAPALADGDGASGPAMRAIFDHRAEARPIPWEQTRLPRILRRHRLDLVFSPSYSLPPFTGTPRMVTLHDLSFEHLPRELRFRERWRRRLLARLAGLRAQRVLADTEQIADDLASTYRIARSRIGIVPLAVDEKFLAAREQRADDALARLGVRRPYLLQLGTILPRRRIDLTLAAFAALAAERPDLELVLVGEDRLPAREELSRRIAASGVGGRVRRLGWVPEEALPALYSGAAASIYVSTYEGYGLPPLESLAAGRPCIVAAGLALDTLWPDYPHRVAALDAEAATAALRRALDEPWPGDSAAEAARVARAITWADCARRLDEQVTMTLEAAT